MKMSMRQGLLCAHEQPCSCKELMEWLKEFMPFVLEFLRRKRFKEDITHRRASRKPATRLLSLGVQCCFHEAARTKSLIGTPLRPVRQIGTGGVFPFHRESWICNFEGNANHKYSGDVTAAMTLSCSWWRMQCPATDNEGSR